MPERPEPVFGGSLQTPGPRKRYNRVQSKANRSWLGLTARNFRKEGEQPQKKVKQEDGIATDQTGGERKGD